MKLCFDVAFWAPGGGGTPFGLSRPVSGLFPASRGLFFPAGGYGGLPGRSLGDIFLPGGVILFHGRQAPGLFLREVCSFAAVLLEVTREREFCSRLPLAVDQGDVQVGLLDAAGLAHCQP